MISTIPLFSVRAVLPVILVVGLLPSPSQAEHAIADDRVLRVQDDTSVRQYSVPELIAAIGLTELLVKDPLFKQERIFAGFALEPLLSHIGLGDAAELLMVCANGYRVPLETSVLAQPQLRGLLALRDTGLPVEGKSRWLPHRHGTETFSFDPFYLVWASDDDSIDLNPEILPWPFQLTEIRRFDRDTYFAPARPPSGASDVIREGFAVYTTHCGQCHSIRGVGGDVGPALDRDNSLSLVLTTAQLSDFIRHDESLFPQSKMPQFSKLLSPTEIDQVTAYLQAMQPSR